MKGYTVFVALEVEQDGPSRFSSWYLTSDTPQEAVEDVRQQLLTYGIASDDKRKVRRIHFAPEDIRIVGCYRGKLNNLYEEEE